MTTLFRKSLDPPSPRRMMIELLLIWLVIDALMLFGASLIQDDFRIDFYEICITALLLTSTSQLSAGILWSLGSHGRWPERISLPIALLAGVAVLWRLTTVLLDLTALPVTSEKTAIGGLILFVHSVTFTVLAAVFRWCGTTLRSNSHSDNIFLGPTLRLSLVDLFVLTTAAATVCFVVTQIPADGWNSWVSWEVAGIYQCYLIPTSLFVLVAALRRRRLLAYLLWLGIPLALLNGYALFVVVSNFGFKTFVRDLWIFVLVDFLLVVYPLGLILSLEYLRLRGYVFAGTRQSNSMAVIPPTACAAGDGM